MQPLTNYSQFCNIDSKHEGDADARMQLECGHQEGDEYIAKTSKKFSLFHKRLEEYREFHAMQRQKLLEGSKQVRTLTWFCLDGCNGIGDRVKGMYTVLLLAMMTKRVFFVFQSDTVDKSMYIEPNLIDWRYYNSCLQLRRETTLVGHVTKIESVGKIFSEDAEHQHIAITHQQHPFGDLQEPMTLKYELVPQISNQLEEQLGIESSTYDEYFHYLYPVMNHFLYKLPQVVLGKVKLALESLDLTPQGYVAVHIRTGFKNSWFGEIVLSKEFREGWFFARSKEVWKGILDCAVDLADKKFGKQSSLFLCADDAEPKQFALDLYGDRIKMLDTHPTHVGRWLYGSKDRNSHLDSWVELVILAEAHTLVKVSSGFSAVASRFCALPPANKYTFGLRTMTCEPGTVEW